MSIRYSTSTSRSFIIGSRLCPPATSRAELPRRLSNEIAWSMLVARSYSKGAGTCIGQGRPVMMTDQRSAGRVLPVGRPRSSGRTWAPLHHGPDDALFTAESARPRPPGRTERQRKEYLNQRLRGGSEQEQDGAHHRRRRLWGVVLGDRWS